MNMLFAIVAAAGIGGGVNADVAPAAWQQPLDNLAQVACHNCYEPQYSHGLPYTAALVHVKTVEIDIWDERDTAAGDALPEHWFVRHNGSPDHASGNDNSCVGESNDLRACLGNIRDWSRANPNHFPLIVILDKKQDWSAGRMPQDLDHLAHEILGSSLYSPAQLDQFHAQRSGSLRDKVRIGGWPKAQDLRGRILLVLNGNGLQRYLQDQGLRGLVFVSPPTESAAEADGLPRGFDPASAGLIVMHNMKSDFRAASAAVARNHFIGRVWGDDKETFTQQMGNRTQLSAYYNYMSQQANGYRIVPMPTAAGAASSQPPTSTAPAP